LHHGFPQRFLERKLFLTKLECPKLVEEVRPDRNNNAILKIDLGVFIRGLSFPIAVGGGGGTFISTEESE
jgi:hypothetical protein